ncbi:hypothetical protein L208DRAFT_1442303 [Tricholoma matsutake]|nr:hypothetical protein L208DRAFT_1442303 [Tricholoma matsutake 945]
MGQQLAHQTPAKDVPGLQSTPFMAGVDSHSILEEMLSNKEKAYTHTEDNKVFYYKSSKDVDGGQRFDQCGPQIFRRGDIVEVQVSFVAVPIRSGSPTKLRRKMLVVLRSIALLDPDLSTCKLTLPMTPPLSTLKRRVGYEGIERKRMRAREDESAGMEV